MAHDSPEYHERYQLGESESVLGGVHRRHEISAYLKVESIDLPFATDTRPRELLGACVTVAI
jgi:hypothetical protein